MPCTLGRDHPDCLAMLLNPEVIAINQDPAAHPPRLISQTARAAVPDPGYSNHNPNPNPNHNPNPKP